MRLIHSSTCEQGKRENEDYSHAAQSIGSFELTTLLSMNVLIHYILLYCTEELNL